MILYCRHEQIWHDEFQIKITLDARVRTLKHQHTEISLWVGYGRDVESSRDRGGGVEDQEGVPDLICDDIDNNPSAPQGIANLAESICQVG